MTPAAALDARTGSLAVEIVLAAGALIAAIWRRAPRARRDAQVELRVEEEGETRTLRLLPPVTLGRGQDALLRVSDPHASRLHAILDTEDGFAFVEDLGSRNGTLVNARPIDGRVRLSPGDEIGLGRVRVVFIGEVPWT